MGVFLGLLALGGLAWLLGSGSSSSRSSSNYNSYNSYDYQPRQSVESSYRPIQRPMDPPASYRTAVRTTTLSTTESTESSTESVTITTAPEETTTVPETPKKLHPVLNLLHMAPFQINENISAVTGQDNTTKILSAQLTESSTEVTEVTELLSSTVESQETTTSMEQPRKLGHMLDLLQMHPPPIKKNISDVIALTRNNSYTETSPNVNVTTLPLKSSVQPDNTQSINETVEQEGDRTPSVPPRFLLSWNQVLAVDVQVISSCSLPGSFYYIDTNDELRRVSTTGLFTSANVVLATNVRHFAQGFDGSVWYITKGGQLWRMRRQEKPRLVPSQIEGTPVFVAVHSYDEVAVVTVDGGLYRWTNQQWLPENNVNNVSVIGFSKDGSLLYADSNQSIWKKEFLAGKYEPYEVSGHRFGIYNAETIVVVDAGFSVSKRVNAVWIPVGEKCSGVSVGEDSFVCLSPNGMAKLLAY